MSLEEQLCERFVCAKCRHRTALVERVAATGTGVSRFLDIQHQKFVAVSCANCGFTELYNPKVLEGQSHLGDILDLLFER